MPHPCLSCGACCAAFRVAFHWSETEPAAGGVTPADMTEPVDPHRVAMRGTYAGSGRCIALQGDVGVATRCSIYADRPSPCRAVQPSWEHGAADAQCDRARARHRLPPLQPVDWTPARNG